MNLFERVKNQVKRGYEGERRRDAFIERLYDSPREHHESLCRDQQLWREFEEVHMAWKIHSLFECLGILAYRIRSCKPTPEDTVLDQFYEEKRRQTRIERQGRYGRVA